jgi:hypothetical protein
MLNDHIKETIDRVDGYTIGTLVVDGNDVSLQLNNGAFLMLDNTYSIEVRNGSDYVKVTVQDAIRAKTDAGWPLYAGLYAKVKKAQYMKASSKQIDHRIAYYLRKVAEKGAIHPARKPPRSHTYRHQRLLAYKAEMHRQIDRLRLGGIEYDR